VPRGAFLISELTRAQKHPPGHQLAHMCSTRPAARVQAFSLALRHSLAVARALKYVTKQHSRHIAEDQPSLEPIMEMTAPVAQPIPASAQAAPVTAQAVPALIVKTNEGCNAARCTHITLMVFGSINIVWAILSILVADVIGLVVYLAMGILGVVAGSMMNPCGCCGDPKGGGCACGHNTKCISIMSIVNSLFHLAVLIWTIVLMAQIGDACDVGQGGCGGLGALFIIALGVGAAWDVISGIICVVAAVTAWKAGAATSDFVNLGQI